MRNSLISLLPFVAALATAANAQSADADDSLTGQSPVLTERAAEAKSRAAWEALASRVPNLGGTRQSEAARAVPRIEDVETPRQVCFKQSVRYMKRRVCLSQEQWLAEFSRHSELRDALRLGNRQSRE